MKKLFLLPLFVFVLACDSEILSPVLETAEVIKTPYLEHDYLVFESATDMFNILYSKKTVYKEQIDSWQSIEGFKSLEESFLATIKSDSIRNVYKLYDGRSNIGIIPDGLNINDRTIAKLVNGQGIVKAGRSLYQFTKDSLKILSVYNGSFEEKKILIMSDKDDKRSGIIVKTAQLMPLMANHNSARLAPFSYQSFGNWVLVAASPQAYTYGRVEGGIAAYQMTWPNYCWDDTEPAMPVEYICGWNNMYRVSTGANFHLSNSGVVPSWTVGIICNLNVFQGTITASGQGNNYTLYYGLEKPDVTGSVEYSSSVFYQGLTLTSSASINL